MFNRGAYTQKLGMCASYYLNGASYYLHSHMH